MYGEVKVNNHAFLTTALNECWFTASQSASVPLGQEAGWAPESVKALRRRTKSLISDGNRTQILVACSLYPLLHGLCWLRSLVPYCLC
jgi:hypothetical protein